MREAGAILIIVFLVLAIVASVYYFAHRDYTRGLPLVGEYGGDGIVVLEQFINPTPGSIWELRQTPSGLAFVESDARVVRDYRFTGVDAGRGAYIIPHFYDMITPGFSWQTYVNVCPPYDIVVDANITRLILPGAVELSIVNNTVNAVVYGANGNVTLTGAAGDKIIVHVEDGNYYVAAGGATVASSTAAITPGCFNGTATIDTITTTAVHVTAADLNIVWIANPFTLVNSTYLNASDTGILGGVYKDLGATAAGRVEFTIRAQANPATYNNAQVLFAYDTYYMYTVTLAVGAGTVDIKRYPIAGGTGATIASVAASLASGAWYDVHVVVNNGRVTATVTDMNGATVATVSADIPVDANVIIGVGSNKAAPQFIVDTNVAIETIAENETYIVRQIAIGPYIIEPTLNNGTHITIPGDGMVQIPANATLIPAENVYVNMTYTGDTGIHAVGFPTGTVVEIVYPDRVERYEIDASGEVHVAASGVVDVNVYIPDTQVWVKAPEGFVVRIIDDMTGRQIDIPIRNGIAVLAATKVQLVAKAEDKLYITYSGGVVRVTRSDGTGVPAYVWVYDSSGNVVSYGTADPRGVYENVPPSGARVHAVYLSDGIYYHGEAAIRDEPPPPTGGAEQGLAAILDNNVFTVVALAFVFAIVAAVIVATRG